MANSAIPSAGEASLVSTPGRLRETLKWAFSFPALLGTVFVGVAFYVARQLSLDPDVWWHLKDGEAILATHRWPTSDPYSFTVHGFPWIAFEWLGDVTLGAALKFGGVHGLEALLFVLGTAILLGLYALATISSKKSKAGFATVVLLTPMVIAQFNLRPQMLGYLFLVLAIIILVRFREGKTGTLWFFPFLMMLWINSHGSWVIGMGVLVAYWMAGLFEFHLGGIEGQKWSPNQRTQISLVFLLSLILLLVNPYGTELVAFPFQVARGYQVSHTIVNEWLPMNFNLVPGKVFLLLVLAFIVAQVIFEFTWRVEELALCLFGAFTAFVHLRFVLLFVPFFTPLLARILARWLPEYSRKKDKYVLNGVLMAGAAAAMVFFYPTRASLEQKIEDQFPARAVQYMRAHPVPGPTFNSYWFGGYLLWSGQRVFLDGRSELYEDGGVLQDFAQLDYLRTGGLDILRRYQIRSCLLQPDAPLATVLAALPDWQKVYSDHTSVLYVRRGPVPAWSLRVEKPFAAAETDLASTKPTEHHE